MPFRSGDLLILKISAYNTFNIPCRVLEESYNAVFLISLSV
jgi:hypothetical protein